MIPAICSYSKMDCANATKLLGGWLGLGAEEGRAKLRKALGRCREPLIQGYPNGTSCLIDTPKGEGTRGIETS